MKKLNFMITTLGLSLFLVSCASNKKNIEQYGTMHEAIGQKKSQGRVELSSLVKRSNYIGIGAIENLDGEVTIVDGKAIITEVNKYGKPKSMNEEVHNKMATMFVGGQVKIWQQIKTPKSMSKAEFEKWITKESKVKGLNGQAFMFKTKGRLTNVRMHVINGACPLHARMHKIVLSKNQKAYEGKFSSINAMIVGVYAANAVGKLTHPDTNIHPHIVYTNSKGIQLTGHLEDFDINAGTTVYLPKL